MRGEKGYFSGNVVLVKRMFGSSEWNAMTDWKAQCLVYCILLPNPTWELVLCMDGFMLAKALVILPGISYHGDIVYAQTHSPIRSSNCKMDSQIKFNSHGMYAYFKTYLYILIASIFLTFYPFWFGSDKKDGQHWMKNLQKVGFLFCFLEFQVTNPGGFSWPASKIRSPWASGRLLTFALW